VREVSDEFLLNMAEVCAGLIGLFLVGVFFYVETGFRRLGPQREGFEAYIRASTKIVLLLFAIPLSLSLTLVVLEPVWNTILFAILCVLVVAANVDTAGKLREADSVTRSTALWVNEVIGTALVAILVVLPWILGGIDPSREDLTWAILLSFASAFLSIITIALSVFDVSRAERQPPKRPPRAD
jgi:hypothetical protein